ncbi:hypothetical protein LguiB_025945 [Lonicera macranthoides]
MTEPGVLWLKYPKFIVRSPSLPANTTTLEPHRLCGGQNTQNSLFTIPSSQHHHTGAPPPVRSGRCRGAGGGPMKASDALPLSLDLTNGVFMLLFTVVYYLLTQWREKIRNSTPLHVVTLSTQRWGPSVVALAGRDDEQ